MLQKEFAKLNAKIAIVLLGVPIPIAFLCDESANDNLII